MIQKIKIKKARKGNQRYGMEVRKKRKEMNH